MQAQCSALNQVSRSLILLTVPPRLRAETMVRFHPIAQKQKTDLNIASVLVRAGGPGPGRAKTKPGRKSGCHIDLAWARLG